MRQHFGIRFRAKVGVAAAEQLLFKRMIIFDHTIMNERQFSTGIEVRMRVFIRDFAVCGPASVTDAQRP